ncbi:V-type ATP synthase subunit E [Methanoregula sp.]|uniref:V-type ATP synthase subunit E n=1 Tax=Methanoregula sp. TaxID=2052170 RepID=UPI0035693B8D
MAYENLLRSVEESAGERERELRSKAQKQAEEIRAKAKKQAEEIQQTAIRESERSALTERNKMLYLAKGEIKEQELKGREKTFRAAFDGAKQQLALLREDPEYPKVFERLATEAVSAMGEVSFIVHVDKRDLELSKKTLAAMGIRCEIHPDLECAGGLVVSSPDGLVTLSNTIESRLERTDESRKLEIYAILSGE